MFLGDKPRIRHGIEHCRLRLMFVNLRLQSFRMWRNVERGASQLGNNLPTDQCFRRINHRRDAVPSEAAYFENMCDETTSCTGSPLRKHYAASYHGIGAPCLLLVRLHCPPEAFPDLSRGTTNCFRDRIIQTLKTRALRVIEFFPATVSLS